MSTVLGNKTDIDGASKRKSTHSLSSSLLARISSKRHSHGRKADTEECKFPSRKACAFDNQGDVDLEGSQTATNSATYSTSPPSSNQRSRAHSIASMTSRTSDQTIEHIPLHRCPPRRVSATSSVPVSSTHALEDGLASASISTTSPPPDNKQPQPFVEREWDYSERRDDPVGYREYAMAELRYYFALNGATTRYQRRKYLHARADHEHDPGAMWLYNHPSDLWDTKAEEKAAFTLMESNVRAAEAGLKDIHGLEKRPEGHARLGKRAKDVG